MADGPPGTARVDADAVLGHNTGGGERRVGVDCLFAAGLDSGSSPRRQGGTAHAGPFPERGDRDVLVAWPSRHSHDRVVADQPVESLFAAGLGVCLSASGAAGRSQPLGAQPVQVPALRGHAVRRPAGVPGTGGGRNPKGGRLGSIRGRFLAAHPRRRTQHLEVAEAVRDRRVGLAPVRRVGQGATAALRSRGKPVGRQRNSWT